MLHDSRYTYVTVASIPYKLEAGRTASGCVSMEFYTKGSFMIQTCKGDLSAAYEHGLPLAVCQSLSRSCKLLSGALPAPFKALLLLVWVHHKLSYVMGSSWQGTSKNFPAMHT